MNQIKIFSEEHKRKLSESNKGRIAWNKGGKGVQVYSEERNQKISRANKGHFGYWTGRKMSREHKQKIREAHKGKIFSEEHKKNLSKARLAEKNPAWKGGVTPKTILRMAKSSWKKLATKIRERDRYVCIYCKTKIGTDIHHMLPVRLGGTDDEKNLVTLCKSCHTFIEAKIID